MATGTGTGRTRTTRPVLLAGVAIGTCLAVLTMWDGGRLSVPDIPSILGAALGALIVWALFVVAAAIVSELAVRHHRAVLRRGWRFGKSRGRAAGRWSLRAYRGVAAWSLPWRRRALGYVRARWAGRSPDAPLIARPAGPVPAEITDPGSEPDAAPPPRRVCAACGNPEGGKFGPLVTYREVGVGAGTYLIHLAHFEDESTGYYGQPYTPAGPAVTDTTPGGTMTEPAAQAEPAPRSGGRRVLTIGTVPAEWKNLVAITADFDPEDDAELLAWMASEVNGMAAYAEALTEVYETGVSSIGLDPVSLAALHDTADAAADAAQAMAYARQKFASHYAEVREFAAAGGLLPHDGRWITGDGD
jgi:hypothetical protein